MKLPLIPGLERLLAKPKPRPAQRTGRPFRAVQIEVTSRCSTGCLFCPHHALSGQWMDGDMPAVDYREHIVPHLELFDLVYLQGWGEPMLHPDLWGMLEMARQKGCQTGFTTNGTWLREQQNDRLIDAGVDMISVSFAGTAAGIHQSLRTRSDFLALCSNFENLAALKKRRSSSHPWLELHFLMTRANLGELPGLVGLAASLGADEVVATNLAYAPSLSIDNQRVFAEQPLPADLAIVEQARQAAQRLAIPIRIYPLQAEPNTLVCDADPPNTIYINHRGEISPCVYLGLTMQGRIPRYYHGEPRPFDAVSYGNVSNGLQQALDSRARKDFVQAFERRRASGSPLALLSYMAEQRAGAMLAPPPAPCMFCYKMLGI